MHELDRCVVFVGSQVLLDGYVRSFDGGVMRVESEEPVLGSIAPGTEVSTLVFDEIRGECHYWAVADQSRARGVDLVSVEMIQSVQKRGVARVRTEIPLTGVLEPHPGSAPTSAAASGADPDREPDGAASPGQPIAFTVLDVSAHGMQAWSKVPVRVGRRFTFRFTAARAPLPLTAEVLRVQESRTGYRYGCRFVNQDERSAEELFRFVMQEQGAQRRNRLLG